MGQGFYWIYCESTPHLSLILAASSTREYNNRSTISAANSVRTPNVLEQGRERDRQESTVRRPEPLQNDYARHIMPPALRSSKLEK